MAVTTSQKLNKYSSMLTQTISQVGSQAMLYGVGLSDEDMKKPQVGIASMGWEGNTCNMHLNALARRVKKGVQEAGQVGLIFHTIGVSDGISMGTAGMKLSLLSRDIIADSIEAVMRAQWYDANISLPGCDKNMPGVLIAMARLNRPSLMVYGGTIRPGHLAQPGNGSMQKLDIISAFEAYGHYLAADIDEEQMREVLRNACPGEGACGGMYTANTMASAIESLGMSLPYSSSYPASSEDKQQECLEAGAAIRNLLELDLKPLNILTRQAFENSITVTIALGRLHQRRAASDSDRQGNQRAADHRRFPRDLGPHAPARRSQAQRPVRDGGSIRGWRRPCSAEDAAARRLPARRLHDRHR